MNIKLFAFVFTIVASVAVADDKAPAFPLSKAAKLAEDAIAAASLPADCFLRSITLVQTSEGAPYYRATYKPTVTRRVQAGADPGAVTLEFLQITMEGKVSFEKQEMPIRQRIQAK